MLRPLLWRESWDHFDPRDMGVSWEIARRVLGPRLSAMKKGVVRGYRQRGAVRRQANVLRRVNQRGTVENVLFVCYGNICRSPFAERLLRQSAPELKVSSCGFIERENRRSPEKMVDAGRVMGIDLSEHRSGRFTAGRIAQADLIVVMDWWNYELMEKQFPEALDKTVFLGLFSDQAQVEIADPYDLSEEQVREVAGQIRAAVEGLRARL